MPGPKSVRTATPYHATVLACVVPEVELSSSLYFRLYLFAFSVGITGGSHHRVCTS